MHAALIAFGEPCPVSEYFAANGRQLLASLQLPEPWRSNVEASLAHINALDDEIRACEADLRAMGADHRYVALLRTMPGVAWVLGYTIASEIGDIARFSSPKELVGYSVLCPIVRQSGTKDHRGPLAKNRPK